MIKKYALIKLIEVLISETNETTMIELAKRAKISIPMTKFILDYLNKEDLIIKKKINEKTSLFALKDNFVNRQIKVLKILLDIHKSNLVNEIIDLYKSDLFLVCLYGSCASGSYDEKSDIDLLIITRKNREHKILKSTNKLNKELNVLIYTLNEWKDKSKEDNVFYERVISNNIPLYGEKPII